MNLPPTEDFTLLGTVNGTTADTTLQLSESIGNFLFVVVTVSWAISYAYTSYVVAPSSLWFVNNSDVINLWLNNNPDNGGCAISYRNTTSCHIKPTHANVYCTVWGYMRKR